MAPVRVLEEVHVVHLRGIRTVGGPGRVRAELSGLILEPVVHRLQLPGAQGCLTTLSITIPGRIMLFYA